MQPEDPTAAPAEGPRTPPRATTRLRAWLGEAPTRNSPPYSRYRWARLLTYFVLGWVALAIAAGGGAEVSDSYRIAFPVALITTSSRPPPSSWPAGARSPPGRCPWPPPPPPPCSPAPTWPPSRPAAPVPTGPGPRPR
ncbi:hypothetical protein ACFQ3Z_25310 [Streptomyces nogalater]